MTDRDEKITEIETKIGALISEHADRVAELLGRPGPFVTAWGVSYEYQSVEDHARDIAGQSVIVPDGQMVSSSLGLGVFLQHSFMPQSVNR
jgi:hypothetical protein